MSVESIPRDLKHLRACLLCSMIKVSVSLFNRSPFINGDVYFNHNYLFIPMQSQEQFELDGCDNCEELLGMKNNREMVFDCTSSNFDGYVLDVVYCCLNFLDIPIFFILLFTLAEW